LFKLVWINLGAICKSFKLIYRKIKGKVFEKLPKGHGRPSDLAAEAAHGPLSILPELVPPSSFFPRWQRAPPASATLASSTLVRNQWEDTDAARFSLNEILTISIIITCLICAYITPSTPSPFPPLLNPRAARWWCSVDDVNNWPVGNPKRKYDEHSSKSSLSCETKLINPVGES
jgi:hypothetical protein